MIGKLDSKMDCVEITVLGNRTECLGFDSAKEIGKKLNELVDAVNKLQKDYDNVCIWVGEQKLNYNPDTTKGLSTLVEEPEPTDPYAEPRGWMGFICRFWYDNPNDTLLDYLDKIQMGKNGLEYYAKESGDWFPNCEPVLPTDNAIYKGGDNE